MKVVSVEAGEVARRSISSQSGELLRYYRAGRAVVVFHVHEGPSLQMLEVHLPDISHGHSISDDDAEALELGFQKAALEISTQIRAAREAAALSGFIDVDRAAGAGHMRLLLWLGLGLGRGLRRRERRERRDGGGEGVFR